MRWSILRRRLGFIEVSGVSLAPIRWVLTFVILCCIGFGAVKADSWLPPKTEVYLSGNGQFRLAITPRDINSPLKYFETKVKGETLPELLGPTGALERMVEGKWLLVWSIKLVNEVSPVSALVSNDGSVVTFDNWHSVGYGDDVVVIYGQDGRLVRSLALDQIVPSYFVDGFQRSVSSIWWRESDPKISGQMLELEFSAPSKSEDKKLKFAVRIGLEDGSVEPIPESLLAVLKPSFCEAHRSEVAGTNAYLANQRKDLVAPTSDDRDEWAKYWYQAMQRLAPDDKVADGDLFGDEVDFELLRPGEYMAKDFRDGFREALLAPVAELQRRWFTSVDQEQLTREIERTAKKIKPGQLAGAEMRFFVDKAHWPRIVTALSDSGAQLVQIDPVIAIPQKAKVLASLPPPSLANEACSS